MSRIRVAIADAHFVVREGLKYIFSHDSSIKLVGECSSGKEIPDLLKKKIDVLVFDFDNGDYIRFEDLQKVFRIAPATKVLIISAHTEKADVHRIMRQEISGFLSKECSETEILEALRATANGNKFYCNRILDIISSSGHADKDASCDPMVLSKREVEVIEFLAQGLTAADVADRMCLSVHTINTHRKNIFKKLGVNSTTELVRFAMNASIV